MTSRKNVRPSFGPACTVCTAASAKGFGQHELPPAFTTRHREICFGCAFTTTGFASVEACSRMVSSHRDVCNMNCHGLSQIQNEQISCEIPPPGPGPLSSAHSHSFVWQCSERITEEPIGAQHCPNKSRCMLENTHMFPPLRSSLYSLVLQRRFER